MAILDDERVRSAMFTYLDALVAHSADGSIRFADVNRFAVDGHTIPLILQSGIRKPAGLSAAITITTTYPTPGRPPPYDDAIGPDGLVRYKYRGTDPQHAENRGLREAMIRGSALAYFLGVAKGVYVPRYPVWIRAEDPVTLEFAVAVDEVQRFVDLASTSVDQRRYLERVTKVRLHQQVFRARVLRAYSERCAMCRFHHPRLLDAAHIIPDGEPHGEPVVPNGLSLCKIHHAAYDAHLLGVRPDLRIEVASHLVDERDGPMLRHGFLELADTALQVPKDRASRPDPDRLSVRYREFLEAS